MSKSSHEQSVLFLPIYGHGSTCNKSSIFSDQMNVKMESQTLNCKDLVYSACKVLLIFLRFLLFVGNTDKHRECLRSSRLEDDMNIEKIFWEIWRKDTKEIRQINKYLCLVFFYFLLGRHDLFSIKHLYKNDGLSFHQWRRFRKTISSICYENNSFVFVFPI